MESNFNTKLRKIFDPNVNVLHNQNSYKNTKSNSRYTLTKLNTQLCDILEEERFVIKNFEKLHDF